MAGGSGTGTPASAPTDPVSQRYDLAVDGVRDLSRSGLFKKETEYREPLDGIADGSNLLFRTQYRPILSTESLIVYESMSGDPVSSGSYAANYDTGSILFTSNAPPSQQPAISYTWANQTLRQFKQILMDGFATMELLVHRGWRLTSSIGTYSAADEDDSNIYVVGSGDLNDPTTGDTTFSLSKTQVGFFQCCCRIAYINNRLLRAAEDDIDYREDRGISVTRTGRAPNLERAFQVEWQKMQKYIETVYEEIYDAADIYGDYIAPLATEFYLSDYEWQEASRLLNLREMYKYSIS